MQQFALRFTLLWREMAALVNSRFDDLESQPTTTIASASTTALGVGNRQRISGTTTINLLSKPNLRGGVLVVLHFTGLGLTLKHNQAASGDGKPMMLVGSADVVVTANDQIILQYDEQDDKFYQVAPVVAI